MVLNNSVFISEENEAPGSRCAAAGCGVKAAPPPSAHSPGDCKPQEVVSDTVTGWTGGVGAGRFGGRGYQTKWMACSRAARTLWLTASSDGSPLLALFFIRMTKRSR